MKSGRSTTELPRHIVIVHKNKTFAKTKTVRAEGIEPPAYPACPPKFWTVDGAGLEPATLSV